MAVEKGQEVLLKVGDGGSAISGTIYSVAETTGVYTIVRSSGDFTAASPAIEVGDVLHVAGFTTNGSLFHGIVSAVAALAITITNVIDADGNPLTPVDEAAGATITLTYETFNNLKGQDDTQMAVSMGEIDASTKDTGIWGASLGGTARMTITANGKVNWPDTNGFKKIADELHSEEDEMLFWLKIVLNTTGDYWFGQFTVTNCQIGGAKDGATTYQLSFANKTRPRRVLAS